MGNKEARVEDAAAVAAEAARDTAPIGSLLATREEADRWLFDFGPVDQDALGGGVEVVVDKRDLTVLSVVRQQ